MDVLSTFGKQATDGISSLGRLGDVIGSSVTSNRKPSEVVEFKIAEMKGTSNSSDSDLNKKAVTPINSANSSTLEESGSEKIDKMGHSTCLNCVSQSLDHSKDLEEKVDSVARKVDDVVQKLGENKEIYSEAIAVLSSIGDRINSGFEQMNSKIEGLDTRVNRLEYMVSALQTSDADTRIKSQVSTPNVDSKSNVDLTGLNTISHVSEADSK